MVTTPKAGPATSGCKPDWLLGDFIRPAGCRESLVVQFIARLPVVPGMRVLDLGCCSSASTLLNTRAQGCVTRATVSSTTGHRPNQTPSAKAILAGPDAQEDTVLPYPDADFDLVLNFFGSVFGLRPELAAAEMTRVCKPGGTVALAGWIPLGLVAALFQSLDRHLGAVANPPRALWEDEAGVRAWFGAGIADLRVTRRTARLCFPYPVTETVEYFRRHVVSIHEHFAVLRPADHAALRQELEAMFREHNMAGANATELQADVLEVIGRRR